MQITRREAVAGEAVAVLGMGGVCGAALASGSAAEQPAYRYAKTPAEVAGMQAEECDVLVVGGGGAGICAALVAAEQGARVAIVEKMGYFGGATAMSSGKIPAVGTSLQRERAELDSVGACAMDIFRPSNYSVRPDLVYTVVENSNAVVEWTAEHGVVWTLDESLYYGQTAHRMHTADGAGAGLVGALLAAMDAQPAIAQHLTCAVRGLVVDGGAVVGAYTTAADGTELAFSARATVLATTGFGNNPEMIARYCPEASPAVPVVAPAQPARGSCGPPSSTPTCRTWAPTRATRSIASTAARPASRASPTTAASWRTSRATAS